MRVKVCIQIAILDPFDPLDLLLLFFIVEKISFNGLTYCTMHMDHY